MATPPRRSVSYQDAGVNIDAGNALVEKIKPIAARTRRPEMLQGLGGFGALFQLPGGYQEPVLVSGTDGVGTKLRLAIDLNRHDTVGIDLVAMCVNDLLVTGASPLFFLDYYATGKLDIDVAANVVSGIGQGCELAGCALVGGETAEMPGMYAGADYDLAGFCVGIVEKSRIIDGSQVVAGDVLIGLNASGPHSNGYSLIRKLLKDNNVSLDSRLDGHPLADLLLAPTRIYVQSIHQLLDLINVKAMSHITGGGIIENLPRVMPAGTRAVVNTDSWPELPVFSWLKQAGNMTDTEMYRTFNCGIGMVLVVAPNEAELALGELERAGETARIIGHIESSDRTEPAVALVRNGH